MKVEDIEIIVSESSVEFISNTTFHSIIKRVYCDIMGVATNTSDTPKQMIIEMIEAKRFDALECIPVTLKTTEEFFEDPLMYESEFYTLFNFTTFEWIDESFDEKSKPFLIAPITLLDALRVSPRAFEKIISGDIPFGVKVVSPIYDGKGLQYITLKVHTTQKVLDHLAKNKYLNINKFPEIETVSKHYYRKLCFIPNHDIVDFDVMDMNDNKRVENCDQDTYDWYSGIEASVNAYRTLIKNSGWKHCEAKEVLSSCRVVDAYVSGPITAFANHYEYDEFANHYEYDKFANLKNSQKCPVVVPSLNLFMNRECTYDLNIREFLDKMQVTLEQQFGSNYMRNLITNPAD